MKFMVKVDDKAITAVLGATRQSWAWLIPGEIFAQAQQLEIMAGI